MSTIAGILTTAGTQAGASTNELVGEFQQGILVRNSKGLNVGTTLFGLMSRLKNEPAENVDYNWFERSPVRRTVYATAAFLNTDTTLTFDDGSGVAVYGILQPGVILRRDGSSSTELLRVLTVTNTSSSVTTVTVSTFDGTRTGISDNDTFTIVTLGKDEGATPATAVFETAETLTNYIQTFNSTVSLANAFKGSKLRTDIEGPLRERRVQALERIARDIELAYFLGKASGSTSGTNGRIYYTGGIKSAVDTAVTAGTASSDSVLNGGGGSGTSLANVQAWLQSFLTVGSDAKLMLAGPKSYAAFSSYANSGTNGFRITGQEQVFGMNITTINTPFGAVDLAMHPLFKELSEYNDWAFVIDLAMVVQKVMEPLFLEPNIQTPGQDSYQEQFRAKLGLKLKFAACFGYAYDFSKIT